MRALFGCLMAAALVLGGCTPDEFSLPQDAEQCVEDPSLPWCSDQ
jgi:hypothetical protein